MLNKVIR
jgi:aminomethyltransferase